MGDTIKIEDLLAGIETDFRNMFAVWDQADNETRRARARGRVDALIQIARRYDKERGEKWMEEWADHVGSD